MRRTLHCVFGVAATILIVTAACTSSGDQSGNESKTPQDHSTEELPGRSTTGKASDGGDVEVREAVVTPLRTDSYGNTPSVVGVEVANTSKTDLLYVTVFDLTVRAKSEDANQTYPDNDVHMLLPGEATVYGGVYAPDFEPATVQTSIETTGWYPMDDLNKLGAELKIDQINSKVEVRDSSITGTVKFETFLDKNIDANFIMTQELYTRVVLRDREGKLIGAWRADKLKIVESAGKHTATVDVMPEDWPAEANADRSKVVVSWYSGLQLDWPSND